MKVMPMTKTIHELSDARDRRVAALAMIAFIYCIVLFYFHMDQLFIFISVFAFVSVCLVALQYDFGMKVNKRLIYLAAEVMNPDLLKEEASHVYPRSDGSWKTRYGRLYYESFYYCLLGNHEKALEAWKSLPTPNDLLRNAKDCGLMQLLVRAGQVEEAEQYLEDVQRMIMSNEKMAAICMRAVGAFYAAKGDGGAGREYLAQAYSRARYSSEKMGILFDFGVLTEKIGKQEEAIDYYCQAAGLAPKTWLGQEAARRAKALQHAQQHQVEDIAPQDDIGGVELSG